MLQVLDQNGNDLLLNPLELMSMSLTKGTVPIPLYAVVQDLDPGARVSASLDWNDGTQPVVFAEQGSPLIVQAQRALGFGLYSIQLTAMNRRSPQPDEISVVFPWQITQTNSGPALLRSIFGPVLPRPSGLPNPQTWDFDVASDLQLLQSNLQMLLLTAIGDRVMLPTYGTNLKRIVFELSTAAVETILQQEISQAVAAWEPRVTLQTISVTSDENRRSISVQATFLSRQSGQPVAVNLQFAQ